MVSLVLQFAACARAGGLRIATAELVDCLRQLRWIDILDEPQFKAVLRANFSKSRREQQYFERLYKLFFHELRPDPPGAHAPSLVKPTVDLLSELRCEPRPAAEAAVTEAVAAFVAGDPGPYLELLRRIGREGGGDLRGPGANLGTVTRRLGVMVQINRLAARLPQLLDSRRGRLSWETRRDLGAHVTRRLDSARRLLSGQAPAATEPRRPPAGFRERMDRLGTTHFASLTPAEIEEMRLVIERLVRKLQDAVGRRRAAARRGALDLKKTLRRSARYQGVPLEMIRRSRPPRKAKIITLCDVSGSVWSAARFMLSMLYALQDCFTQVRSFVFVAGLAEVTAIFKTHEINRAIEKVLREADVDYGASTDYGLTLRQFKQKYFDSLTPKTTLIIIGDGRSNYTNPEEEILGEMRERCRRLIWLNPESEQFWYSGDSEMRLYRSYCHEVRPCQNLDQLAAFVRELIL